MGKLDEKKKQKREALLTAAYDLFTSQGIFDTSISDIVKQAEMAKGTFYLYFKDKFDIRTALITEKAGKLFSVVREKMRDKRADGLERPFVYMFVELVNSTCYNVILYQEPVGLDELKEELAHLIPVIIRNQEVDA